MSTVQAPTNGAGARPSLVVRWCFWTFVALYAALLLYRPALGLIDDHKFLDTVLVGRSLPPFIEYDVARFSPLLAQEYNPISRISPSPAAFYAFNALELLLVAWLLVRIGKAFPTDKPSVMPYVATAIILISPAFTISWFRLWVQEKDELVLLAVFLLAYLETRKTGHRGTAFLSLFCATASLYSKESAFVPVGAIGLFGLLLDRRPECLHGRERTTWQLLHWLLLGTCAAFLAVYYGLVYRHKGEHAYGTQPGNVLLLHLRSIAASLLHEPIFLPALLLLSVLVLLRPRIVPGGPFRVLLLATLALVGAYATLGLSNIYYLLPAFVAVPYLATAVAATPGLARTFAQPWIAVAFGIALLNQTVTAIQQYTLWRVASEDLQAMRLQLTRGLQQNHRVRLFVDGMQSDANGEVFLSLAAYLHADGLTSRQFDLLATVPNDPARYYYMPGVSDYSYTEAAPPPLPQAGDLMLVVPGDVEQRRQDLAASKQYALVFKTDSYAYANLGLKALLQRVFHQPLATDAVIDPNYALYRRLPGN